MGTVRKLKRGEICYCCHRKATVVDIDSFALCEKHNNELYPAKRKVVKKSSGKKTVTKKSSKSSTKKVSTKKVSAKQTKKVKINENSSTENFKEVEVQRL